MLTWLLNQFAEQGICQPVYEIERAGGWATFRKKFLVDNPFCVACGNESSLQIHHKRPYHLYPELELVASNCMTLCSDGPGGMNCHLVIGHGGNFMAWTPCPEEKAMEFRRWLLSVEWERE